MTSFVSFPLNSREHIIRELDPMGSAPVRLRRRNDHRLRQLDVINMLTLLEAAKSHYDDVDVIQVLVKGNLVLRVEVRARYVLDPVVPAVKIGDEPVEAHRKPEADLAVARGHQTTLTEPRCPLVSNGPTEAINNLIKPPARPTGTYSPPSQPR